MIAQRLDDLMFYLPGFASVPLILAGMLVAWLAWRFLKRSKKPKAVEKSEKP